MAITDADLKSIPGMSGIWNLVLPLSAAEQGQRQQIGLSYSGLLSGPPPLAPVLYLASTGWRLAAAVDLGDCAVDECTTEVIGDPEKKESETIILGFNLNAYLGEDIFVIDSPPPLVEEEGGGTDLVITDAQSNPVFSFLQGRPLPARRGVLFRVQGGQVANSPYSLKATIYTNSQEIIIRVLTLEVTADVPAPVLL